MVVAVPETLNIVGSAGVPGDTVGVEPGVIVIIHVRLGSNEP